MQAPAQMAVPPHWEAPARAGAGGRRGAARGGRVLPHRRPHALGEGRKRVELADGAGGAEHAGRSVRGLRAPAASCSCRPHKVGSRHAPQLLGRLLGPLQQLAKAQAPREAVRLGWRWVLLLCCRAGAGRAGRLAVRRRDWVGAAASSHCEHVIPVSVRVLLCNIKQRSKQPLGNVEEGCEGD